MARIEVSRTDVEQFMSRFSVRVDDGGEATDHDVTISRADFERLGGNYKTPEEFVHACFEFLLAREPKEQIMASFDISQIKDHFPDFDMEIDKAPEAPEP